MQDELYHHGIKGMHWGVRRFQNPDGTLTAAGKRRERRDQARADKAARKEAKAARKRAYKNRSLMSEQELDAQIRRYQKEKQFATLSKESLAPGRSAVKNTLGKYGTMALGTAVGITASTVAGGYAKKFAIETLKLDGYIKLKK